VPSESSKWCHRIRLDYLSTDQELGVLESLPWRNVCFKQNPFGNRFHPQWHTLFTKSTRECLFQVALNGLSVIILVTITLYSSTMCPNCSFGDGSARVLATSLAARIPLACAPCTVEKCGSCVCSPAKNTREA
jgi:hypothetical protein